MKTDDRDQTSDLSAGVRRGERRRRSDFKCGLTYDFWLLVSGCLLLVARCWLPATCFLRGYGFWWM